MFPILALSFTQYMRTYKRYAFEFWDTLSPADYGMILVSVLVFGYLLMKSSR